MRIEVRLRRVKHMASDERVRVFMMRRNTFTHEGHCKGENERKRAY